MKQHPIDTPTPRNGKRHISRPIARINPDGTVNVRISAGAWLHKLPYVPASLFRTLPLWQQRYLVDQEFTVKRGFLQRRVALTYQAS